MKLVESTKVVILGIFLFGVSVKAFKKLENKWFGFHIADDSPYILRKKFWKSTLCCLIFVVSIVLVQEIFFNFIPNTKYIMQFLGTLLMLIATYSRGGWDIQTCSAKTPVERIDKGMNLISHFGATGILLFILLL